MGAIIYSKCSLECIVHLRNGELNWVISELLFGSGFTCQMPEESQCTLGSGQKNLSSMRYTI